MIPGYISLAANAKPPGTNFYTFSLFLTEHDFYRKFLSIGPQAGFLESMEIFSFADWHA